MLVPLSVPVAPSLQLAAAVAGQAVAGKHVPVPGAMHGEPTRPVAGVPQGRLLPLHFAGIGFASGTGDICLVMTPLMSMLSSHQPSSWGVSLQPVPYSKYDLVTSSNCQVEPIQRIRILLPRKLSRLNRVCVQTPLPDGSTTPSPHE